MKGTPKHHPRPASYRREAEGFTILELLVVMAVSGVLAGLLLHATQHARETARRTQCANHLKQIGLAALHHHDARGFFPTAGTNSDDFTARPSREPGFERFGWGFQLLPYIEQNALYEGAKDSLPTAPAAALGHRALVEIPVSVYNCPSRGARVAVDASNGAIYALGDYAGVMFGYMGDVQWRNSHDDLGSLGKVYREFGWRGMITKGGQNHNGVYRQWPSVRACDVSDGLSHTLLVMEKAVWTERYSTSTSSSAAMCSEVFGWAHNAHQPTMRSISGDGGLAFGGASGNWYGSPGRGIGPPLRRDDEPRRGQRDWDQGFGSAHNVVLAAFGDGSVRGLDVDIDWSLGGVLFRLGCRDDGRTARPSSYQ